MTDAFVRLDLAGTEAPVFALDARDRHALGALKDYHQRVNGDGVASAAYCNTVQEVIDLFAAWQAANDGQVMSADQPYRSATDHDPAAAAWERAQAEASDAEVLDAVDQAEPAPVGHVHDQDHEVHADALLDQGVWNPQAAVSAPESASADYAAPSTPSTPSPATADPADAQAAYEASLNQPAAGTSTSSTADQPE